MHARDERREIDAGVGDDDGAARGSFERREQVERATLPDHERHAGAPQERAAIVTVRQVLHARARPPDVARAQVAATAVEHPRAAGEHAPPLGGPALAHDDVEIAPADLDVRLARPPQSPGEWLEPGESQRMTGVGPQGQRRPGVAQHVRARRVDRPGARHHRAAEQWGHGRGVGDCLLREQRVRVDEAGDPARRERGQAVDEQRRRVARRLQVLAERPCQIHHAWAGGSRDRYVERGIHRASSVVAHFPRKRSILPGSIWRSLH